MADNHIFRNIHDGCPVAYAVIPEDFRERTELIHERKANGGSSYRYSGEAASPDGSVRIFFDSGMQYIDMRMQPGQAGTMTEDGSEHHPYCDLKTQADEIASRITGSRPSMLHFHAYSQKMQQRLQHEFDILYQKTYKTLMQTLQNQGNIISMQMGEPFLDGGICEYSHQGKSLFIAISRGGYRAILHERYMGRQVADNISWLIPWFLYMVCEQNAREEALGIFRQMAESFDKSQELKSYDERLTEQDMKIADAVFRQNQQMINYAMQQQEAAWGAVERQRDMLSRDLDNFRSGLNQSMQQNDAWRQMMSGQNSSSSADGSSGESTDEYIQRLRHESMMGVNTYVNEEGHDTEFTTQADRVFESDLDDLQHFGTELYYDDHVPDGFSELRRK